MLEHIGESDGGEGCAGAAIRRTNSMYASPAARRTVNSRAGGASNARGTTIATVGLRRYPGVGRGPNDRWVSETRRRRRMKREIEMRDDAKARCRIVGGANVDKVIMF